MANVGSAAAGKTLIGAGTGASPTYADIGTNSGLTQRGVVIAEGTGAFQATAADTNFHKFAITVNSTGTSAAFFIDGVQLANSPITTNIPTTNQLYFGIQQVRTAGTTNSKFVRFDQFYGFMNLNSAR
jgi:hypothetical protein